MHTMRFLRPQPAFRRLASIAFLGSTLAACSSEEAAPPGQLVVALQSDMDLPKDVDQIGIRVLTDGRVHFRGDFPIDRPGTPSPAAQLPATLAVTAGSNPSTPVTIRVFARQNGVVRVLREAVTVIPTDRVALLRMPIQWLCTGSGKETTPGDGDTVQTTCPDGQTCIAGRCEDNYVDPSTLEGYVKESVFGAPNDPAACLDVLACFSPSAVVAVDPATCSFAAPDGDLANVNVALVDPLDGSGTCAKSGAPCFVPLDADPLGGFQVVDGRVHLPFGVCEKLAAGLFYGVAVSTTCPQKGIKQPICSPYSSVVPALQLAEDAPEPTSPAGYIGVKGGEVASPDGIAKLTVPAGAITASKLFTIEEATTPTPPGLVGKAYVFSPDGIVFADASPAVLSFDASLLGLDDPSTVHVARLGDAGWEILDTSNNPPILTASTPHLSVYGLVRDEGAGGAGAGGGGAGGAGGGGAGGAGAGGAGAGGAGAGGAGAGGAGASGAAGADIGGAGGADIGGAGGSEIGGTAGAAGADVGGAGGADVGGAAGVGGDGGPPQLCDVVDADPSTCATQFPNTQNASLACGANPNDASVAACGVVCAKGWLDRDQRVDNGCECSADDVTCQVGAGEHLVAVVTAPTVRVLRWKIGAATTTTTQEVLTYPYVSTQLFPIQNGVGVLGILADTIGIQSQKPDDMPAPLSGMPLTLSPWNTPDGPSQFLRAFGLNGVGVASFPMGSVDPSNDPVQGAAEVPSLFAPIRYLAEGNIQVALWVNGNGELRRRVTSDESWSMWLPAETVAGDVSPAPDSFIALSPTRDEFALIRSDGVFCTAAIPGFASETPSFQCDTQLSFTNPPVADFAFAAGPSQGSHVFAWTALDPINPGPPVTYFASSDSMSETSVGVFAQPTFVGLGGNLHLAMISELGVAVAPVDLVGMQLGQPEEIYTGEVGDLFVTTVKYPEL